VLALLGWLLPALESRATVMIEQNMQGPMFRLRHWLIRNRLAKMLVSWFARLFSGLERQCPCRQIYVSAAKVGAAVFWAMSVRCTAGTGVNNTGAHAVWATCCSEVGLVTCVGIAAAVCCVLRPCEVRCLSVPHSRTPAVLFVYRLMLWCVSILLVRACVVTGSSHSSR
jgi:hypothetical protein